MAKELAWKASRAERPRGFESHALRQQEKRALQRSFFLPDRKVWDENPRVGHEKASRRRSLKGPIP